MRRMPLTGTHPSWSTLLHFLFFLVHSYARVGVGLYQFCTVTYSWPARAQKIQKKHYAKVTEKIAIVPTLPKNPTPMLDRHHCGHPLCPPPPSVASIIMNRRCRLPV